ncbi:MAG: protein-L-isoaspartate(D-aspartate) [Planctomycetota bacterium]|nr:MAG: protein-L-isoaspartate(D-aspartate) [Planctomycetota bacterium]
MPDFADSRREMVGTQLVSRGIRGERILEAFLRVPRHLFVREEDVDRAHSDHPLSLGYDQTISQPYIVALTLERLDPQPGDKVLEIGTGSGYQTALLAGLCREIFTIERLAPLAKSARARLEALGHSNIQFKVDDGTLGWPDQAPFDRIVVSAASPEIPPALTSQLAVGGKLVIPVGGPGRQDLMVVTRTESGLEKANAGECVFVKLIGQGGWREERPEK